MGMSAGTAANGLLQSEACRICGSDALRLLFERFGHNVIECAGCGVHFLNPQPTNEDLGRIYTSQYFLNERDSISPEAVSVLKRATASLYLDILAKSSRLRVVIYSRSAA